VIRSSAISLLQPPMSSTTIPRSAQKSPGVRLAHLSYPQKNDLARLISSRGVVFFRNQDDFDLEAQRELGRYFGTLHKQATTSVPRQPGLEDVHVVFTSNRSVDQRAIFTPTFLWHADVTYELQPPSYTSLKLLTGPPRGGGGGGGGVGGGVGGGDNTLWLSQHAIYDALSSHMQKYLEALTALHSAYMRASGSCSLNRPIRRKLIATAHPLVRMHPVTGWKSLFFNPGFVTKIIGVPKTESNAIIKHLLEVIATTQEAHVRFQWGVNDVAFWDNRITSHMASYGFAPHCGHAVQVACHGEVPVFDVEGQVSGRRIQRAIVDFQRRIRMELGVSGYNGLHGSGVKRASATVV
jgi:sulfonate dioxygenase